jgi:glycosidase
MTNWFESAFFYHIYPLGLCDAPASNDFISPQENRLKKVFAWLDHAKDIGATAIILGPVFESTGHGYDTADFFKVDRRLGDDALLADLVRHAHELGLKVLLDAVFGHTGRDFWAFRDLQKNGTTSAFKDWYRGVDFNSRSPRGDAFAYECWQGAQELPRLRLDCPNVRRHLLDAVRHWVQCFDIDGLRLDTADYLDLEFLTVLRRHTDGLKNDFLLLGEAIHGDYNLLANPNRLHSVTNYEVYKGLWSSHYDCNCFEIAYTLNRQFGETGLYRGIPMYNFGDNHDVDRVASKVRDRSQLFSIYCLLFTMPGMPSVYYGSEWGLEARRTPTDDKMLRPPLQLEKMKLEFPQDILDAIRRLSLLRQRTTALSGGDYCQRGVGAEYIAFDRARDNDHVTVVVNISSQMIPLRTVLPDVCGRHWTDLLNGESGQCADQVQVPPHWARVLRWV